MKVRLLQSLHFKVAGGVISTVLLLSTLYFAWDFRVSRRQLREELQNSASQLSDVILDSLLELAMIGEHPQLLQPALERLGTDSAALEISLLDVSGTVRFSSNPSQVGREYSQQEQGCVDCHQNPNRSPHRTMFYPLTRKSILRAVTLIPNRKECHSCHEPEPSLRGVLFVDFPTATMQARVNQNLEETIFRAGLTVLSILVVLGILMNKLVISRLKKLALATGAMARTGVDSRLHLLEGPDEIGRLAHSFNKMDSRVKTSIEALETQKGYFQDLIDSLQDGVAVVDSSFEVELVNRAAATTWSFQELSDLVQQDSPPSVARTAIRKTLETGQPVRREMRTEKDGRRAFVEIYCSPMFDSAGKVVRVIALFRDITRRRLFETQASRTERLASVGQLAAGIAHEINNPMAAITTCVEGLARQVDQAEDIPLRLQEEIGEYLSTIGEASLRCKEITQRLLNASADPGEVSFSESDLVEVVQEILTLVEHEAERRNVELSSEIVEKGLLQGDRKRLAQLTMNLIMNSLEAVDDGGKIAVSVKAANGFLQLEVTDDGCGISDSELQLVFDPFYTTKRRGRGTGLGLSICESIVRQHQGQIYIESQAGQGTRVTVVLPSLGDMTT